MAITMRRGLEANFDETKLVAGEFAVIEDLKKIAMAFADGTVRYLAMEDYVDDMFAILLSQSIGNQGEAGNIKTHYYGRCITRDNDLYITIDKYYGYEENTMFTLFASEDSETINDTDVYVNGSPLPIKGLTYRAISKGQAVNIIVCNSNDKLRLRYLDELINNRKIDSILKALALKITCTETIESEENKSVIEQLASVCTVQNGVYTLLQDMTVYFDDSRKFVFDYILSDGKTGYYRSGDEIKAGTQFVGFKLYNDGSTPVTGGCGYLIRNLSEELKNSIKDEEPEEMTDIDFSKYF